MIPGADNRFTAFGRVFSGRVATGQKVRVVFYYLSFNWFIFLFVERCVY